MRADSVAFAVVLFGASLAGVLDVEAGGRRDSGVAFVPAATGSIGSVPAKPMREEPAPSGAMPIPSVITPLVTAPAPAPVRDVRTAQAWCGRGRIVGSGSGFCELN